MDASQFRTVDWVADAEEQNRTRLARSRDQFNWRYFATAANSWLIHASSGVVIGGIAVMLTLASGWLSDLKEGHCSTSWYLSKSTCCLHQSEETCMAWVPHPWYSAYIIYVFVSVVFAATASLLVTTIAPLAAGSGISEIKCIISGFFNSPFLETITLIVKCIALPLTIASGLSVGKEGPSVHYAACVGYIVMTKFGRQDYKKRTDILTACCAAGVAVAFGSPMGGLLFGLEEMAAEVSLNTIWRSYFCCLVATSVVAILNPFRTKQLVLFSVQYDSSWHAYDLPFFIIIGIFGGLVGRFVVKYNLRITALRKKYWGAKYYLMEAVFLSLVTALICYFNLYLRVDMTKSMQILFHECDHGGESHPSCNGSNKLGIMASLAIACVIRLALLLVTYGAAKIPAGVFVPSLAVGALFGRFVGTFVWLLHDKYSGSWYFQDCKDGEMCVNPGAYALLGAGALLSGVMHISLTIVVIMFELTGALHYVVPTMIVVGVTSFISSQLEGSGIADMAIKLNHYPYLDREEDIDSHGQTAASIMVPASECVVVKGGGALPRSSKQYRTYPVVDSKNRLIGATSGSKMDKSPITVAPDDSLETVYTLFSRMGPHTIYVVSNGFLSGLITRKMVCKATETPFIEFTAFEDRLGAKIVDVCDGITSKLTSAIQYVRRTHLR